jgi:hypothetical protein
MHKTLFLISWIFLSGCEGGLSPTPPAEPGLSGTVYFVENTWPGTPGSPDSLVNLWIFASQDYPLDSNSVLAGILYSPPRIFVYPALDQNLPFYVDSVQYFFPLKTAFYKYIGIIQHTQPDFNIRSFRVVGFAKSESDSTQPMQVEIREGQIAFGVNIYVNFHKLPPQPF